MLYMYLYIVFQYCCEIKICKYNNIIFIYGVGDQKKSCNWLWKTNIVLLFKFFDYKLIWHI